MAFIEGKLKPTDIPIRNEIKLGLIEVDAGSIKTAQKLVLSVDVSGHINHWDIWVYPAKKENIDKSEILFTSEMNDKALEALEKGGSVLLSLKKGRLKSEKGGDIKVGFSGIFWNTAWTGKQAPHTLGILCDPDHPALSEFPSEFHSNWQWQDAMSHSQAVVLDEFSADLKPVVRVIDDWFENRRLALLFEAKIGKGKLIVSGIDFWSNMKNRPEAGQLLYSIQKYMGGDDFNPQINLKAESIQSLFKEPSVLICNFPEGCNILQRFFSKVCSFNIRCYFFSI